MKMKLDRNALVRSLFAASILVLPEAAVAESATIWIAETPATICQKVSNKDICKFMMTGYVRGLNDAFAMTTLHETKEQFKGIDYSVWWYCIKESGALIEQMTAMFEKSLREHPEEWNSPAAFFFMNHVILSLCEQLTPKDSPRSDIP
jgi:hypothetical protein